MGSQTVELVPADESFTLSAGDVINEWHVDEQIVSVGYRQPNRAWWAHCTFCRFRRVLHEPTLSNGYIPRCPSNCGH